MPKSDMPPSRTPTGAVFPIRTVAALTGVNPITLRAWERRYGLVTPLRTASGRRMYTQADIDTIQRALALVQRGVAIGRARDALDGGRPARAGPSRSSTPWAQQRARMLAAIERFDEQALDQVYDEMLALHPIERVTRDALLPLLIELGQRWRDRAGGVAEEHFLSVYLRNKLGARFHHRSRTADGPTLIVACLPGEHHEVGAFVFALAAHEHGYRVVLLGADMPLPELAYAAHRTRARALVLSGTHAASPDVAGPQLAQLAAAAKVPVFVGGPVAVHQRERLLAAGAVPLGTEIEAALARIAQSLRGV
jgi:DNA-binding transcriptional MerR regulator/methylmalonyl-CoA mutase cobalamin-binding subunit